MTQTTRDNEIRTLHVRYDGRSLEMPFAALDLGQQPSDSEVKEAAAAHLDLPVRAFDRHVVVRHSGSMVLRPEAIYG